MGDYGEILMKKIISGNDFWALFDELVDDKSGFLYNRSIIIDAYKNGNLYGLEVTETDSMYRRCARSDSIFCFDTSYLVPCFCVIENENAIILWVHTRARRRGFGSKLVHLLGITYVPDPLPDSMDFWKACNITTKNTKM